MITPPIVCVVDASVGIKLMINEQNSAEAIALFDHLNKDPKATFFVPELFYLECANILWKLVQRGQCLEVDAKAYLQTMLALRLTSVPDQNQVTSALDLALRFGITAYDATYVAVAADQNVPLVTADDKLVKKMAGSPHAVQLLSSLSIPVPPGKAGPPSP